MKSFSIWRRLATSVLALMCQDGLAAGLGDSPFERFVARPPVIKLLEYSLFEIDGTELRFTAKWQENAFYLEEEPLRFDRSGIQTNKATRIVSQYEELVWILNENGMTETTVADNVLVSMRSKRDRLSFVLNGGVANLPIGGIRWSNHAFAAREVRGEGLGQIAVLMNGCLEYDEHGRAMEMLLLRTREGRDRPVVSRIKYEYVRELPVKHWPSEVSWWVESATGTTLVQRAVIHRLEVAEATMGMEEFDLRPRAAVGEIPVRYLTNGIWYSFNSNGTKSVVPFVTRPPKSKSRNWVGLCFAALVTFSGVLVAGKILRR